MKVIFIPDARNKNLYQTNLSQSLSKQGVDVYFDNGSVIGCIIKNWPDILHIHWPYPFMVANSRFGTVVKSSIFICGLLILKLLGIKLIWTVHNIKDHEERFKYLELLFSRFMVRLCDKLIVHCSLAKSDVKKTYFKDDSAIAMIPHGNYINWYENIMTTSEARDRINIDKEDIVFLCFGQIRPYKGIPELIRAFKRLEHIKTRLLIVGKPLNDEISLDILDSSREDDRIINILRFIPDKDLQLYMNAADIVVLPYKDVLTSGVALLSMSFSKPIIAPTKGCIIDILDEKGSFLYKNDEKNIDPKNDLFDVMKRVIDTDKDILLKMGEHNFGLAKNFGWDQIGKKTFDIYQECLKN